ncbi:hypothetical protein EX30DRAFT_372614 [Ascodesmis nigricans]|uniref:Uncharacterized protein n=1 Tax=Ascodesmis nigricans TaxID=341454 RepID=A0A4S2MTL8_9PEZI|nr:hypothetical protein EX30DRAFT_372614 [Ascodesmis nigricans]
MNIPSPTILTLEIILSLTITLTVALGFIIYWCRKKALGKAREAEGNVESVPEEKRGFRVLGLRTR